MTPVVRFALESLTPRRHTFSVSAEMMKALAIFLASIIATSSAQAIPEIAPYPAASFSGVIERVVSTKHGVTTIRLKEYRGLTKENAVELYRALRNRGRFRVRYPRTSFIEIVLPDNKLESFKVGDRIQVSNYQLHGHSESDSPLTLSESITVQRAEINKR